MDINSQNSEEMELRAACNSFENRANGIHSSILAWEIPWTEEPGRLQSMGSQKSQT